MTEFDQELSQLQAQAARKQEVEALVERLTIQQAQLQTQEEALRNARLAEQADVDRLEGRSLSAFFYNVTGKREEKLEKERREAYEAIRKHEETVRELDHLTADLNAHREELGRLRQAAVRYDQLIEEKARLLVRVNYPASHRILALEEEIARLEGSKKELREAIAAGEAALEQAGLAAKELGSAESWSTVDMIGGGFLSDMVKYDAMNKAKRNMEQLETDLRRFRGELSDVGSYFPQVDIQVGDFLQFADFFFDNIFTDWAVYDRIRNAQNQVGQVFDQLQALSRRLSTVYQDTELEQNQLRRERQQVVFQA